MLYELNEKKKGLSKIEIIEKRKNSNQVEIGSIVSIMIEEEIEKYQLLGNTNSNFNLDIPIITLNSPLGKALYHKEKGDKFSYSVDFNKVEGIIIDIV